MPKPMSRRQLERLASQLPAIVTALTAHRRNKAMVQLVGVHEIGAALAGHGIEVGDGDLLAAIAIAVDKGAVRTEGRPVHSVTALTVTARAPGAGTPPRRGRKS